MLNNKGLVVSSVLYTLLIAFLLFLGVTLAQFSSSAKIISNSTKDLVNNTDLVGIQVHEVIDSSKFVNSSKYDHTKHKCSTTDSVSVNWYETLEKNEYGQIDDIVDETGVKNGKIDIKNSETIARIYSRYGTTFWPRDFNDDGTSKTNKLKLECFKDNTTTKLPSCSFTEIKDYVGLTSKFVTIKVTDTVTIETNSFFITNACQ